MDRCLVSRPTYFTKPQPDGDYQPSTQRRSLRLRALGTRVAGAQGGSSELGVGLKVAMWE